MSGLKPDILLPWPGAEDVAVSYSRENSFHALVCVRPETNRLPYEAEILSAVKAHARVIYIANLNGRLFTEGGILRSRYASQFRFAEDPRAFLAAWPELASAFEEHFGIRAEEAPIRSSLSDLSDLGLTAEGLFSSIVPESDFLAVRGQTFKRIRGVYIVNYDLPAIMARYTPEANVFTILARSDAGPADFYTRLNHAIHDMILSQADTPLMFGEELGGLSWSERVRRTYHISTNRLQAMLDMSDFVYPSVDGPLDIALTPLGLALQAAGAISADDLRAAKAANLCRLAPPGSDLAALAFLPQAGIGLDFKGIAALMRGIAAQLK